MEIVKLSDGILILHSEEAVQKVSLQMQTGGFWEYVSQLIEQDVHREKSENRLLQELNKRLSEFEQRLGSNIIGGGTAAQIAASLPTDDVGENRQSRKAKSEKSSVNLKDLKGKTNVLGLLNKAKSMRGDG